MMLMKRICLVLVVLALVMVPLRGEPFTVLHHFAGGSTDGANPQCCSLVLSGSMLYGMTRTGGSGVSAGTIFKVGTDGNGYAVMRRLTGAIGGDGMLPWGSLIVGGSTLYGMTFSGGSNNKGTIFKIDTDGNNFSLLRSFAGGTTDGYSPYGDLLLVGSTLYGMTYWGGTDNKGVVFKVDTDGANFAILHSFAGATADGESPRAGALVTDGTYLYGMTWVGGESSLGAIFKLKISDSSYSLLHSFAGNASSDGAYPLGQLILSGSWLYGLTNTGGAGTYDGGTIFKLDTDGGNYSLLHSFQGGSDGIYPEGGLTLSGSRLFGSTTEGGAGNYGTIFGIDTNGSNYRTVWSFCDSTSNPGSHPAGSPAMNGGKAYGMTTLGGSSGYGIVYSVDAATAEIALECAADVMMPQGGTNDIIRVVLYNWGPDEATGVEVTDLLPPQLTYVSYSADQGSYDPSTGVWNVGSMGLYALLELRITAKVNSSGTIYNTATRTAQNEVDPDSTNDSETCTITTAPTKNLLPPVLLSPVTGTTGVASPVTLKWLDTNNSPQEVKYKVRIKKQGGTYVNYALAAGTSQYIKSGLAAGKTYYWNVQAVGNGTSTKTSVWANGGVDFKFTVAPPVTLMAPTLVDPANGAAGQPLSVTLQWTDPNSSPNELKYKVRFKIAGGTYVVTTLGPDSTSLLKTGLRPGKTYYWSVMALGNGTSIKNSVWPADSRFTTQ